LESADRITFGVAQGLRGLSRPFDSRSNLSSLLGIVPPAVALEKEPTTDFAKVDS